MSCKTCSIADQCRTFTRAPEQPGSVEHFMADGVGIKTMDIARKGTFVPQHSHPYDHTSYLAKGSVRVLYNSEPNLGGAAGTFYAPFPIFIKAGVKHTFETLEDDTLILCIHNASRTGTFEVLAENSLGV